MNASCKHRIMDKCNKDGKPCFYTADCFEPEETRTYTNADLIEHRFDKLPTARCYCRDCINYKNNKGYCEMFGWYTSDQHFCSFADPK